MTWPWLLVGAAIVLLLLCCAWVLLVGDREGEMVDEEPTLNTRNRR